MKRGRPPWGESGNRAAVTDKTMSKNPVADARADDRAMRFSIIFRLSECFDCPQSAHCLHRPLPLPQVGVHLMWLAFGIACRGNFCQKMEIIAVPRSSM